MTKAFFLVCLFVLLLPPLMAQDSSGLHVSEKFIETKVGDTIRVQITHQNGGQVLMKNAPNGASLSAEGSFLWQVPAQYEDTKITVEFHLLDSGRLMDIKSVFVNIQADYDPPKFFIHSNLKLKSGFYELHPGQKLELNVVGYASQDSSRVVLDHYFNDRPGEYHIGNGKVDIVRNQLTFKWTPLEFHLEQKYFSLTVDARDSHGQNSQHVFVFVVTRKNEPPYFKFPVLDEYLIHANEALEVDLTAVDPDQDSLYYEMTLPTSIGNPRYTNGKFVWKLNVSQMDQLKKQFPIEVLLRVSEQGTDDTKTITKSFLVKQSVKNEPPRILNLQNEEIYEGLTFHRTIFIQDANDDFSALTFDIIGAPKDLTWETTTNAIVLDWTPDYNVIGVEMKPRKFDMLMVVEDPNGSIDQRAFTLTVNHRENTEITYQSYLTYQKQATFLIDQLSAMHMDLERREGQVKNLKKGLSITTMLFAAYTAAGNVFTDGTGAKKAVPYIGIMAAVAGGINAFGFNDLSKYGALRGQLFLLQQKLIYVLAVLREFQIDGPGSPNLENAEFRDQLANYEQSMIQDKLNFKSYYKSYMDLNYVIKKVKRETREAGAMNRKPEGLLFIDLSKI